METESAYMTEEEIAGLTLADLRDLTPDEEMKDNFRRMFQILGLIYQNQTEINNRLKAS